jgi:uncharacterized protein (TIGR02001 family)
MTSAQHSGRARAAALAACAGATLLQPAGARAQQWHGSLAVTSDYVFRGLSQTQGEAAIQADLHYEGGTGWFAGVWGSHIDAGYDSFGAYELDLYAGWNWQLGTDWTARVSYVRYLYPDSTGDVEYDYGDLSARLAWRDRIVGTIAWSPDLLRISPEGYPQSGNGYAYELALRQPFGSRFAATAGAGYYDQLFDVEYASWHVGLTCELGPVELDLARIDTDDTARAAYGREAAGDRWALTALWRF